MKRALWAVVALAIAASLPVRPTAGASAPELLTLERLLQAEEFGDVVFSPDGRWIAFERSIARADLVGTPIESDGLDDRRVFLADRAGTELREIKGQSGERFALAPYRTWSPDGRWLALTAVADDTMSLAAWHAETGRIKRLPARPAGFYPQHAWLAGERLVYVTVAAGMPQRFSHPQMLEHAATRWREVWNGGSEVVTVSSANDVFAGSEAPPNELVVANLADGSSSKIGAGEYVSFFVAPDRQRFAALRLAEASARALDPRGRRGELEVFELGEDRVELLRRFADLDVSAAAWAPSGDRILVGGKPAGAAREESRLYVVDLASGDTRAIQPAKLSFVDPDPYAGWASGILPLGWIDGRPAAVAAHAATGDLPAAPEHGEAHVYGDLVGVRFDVFAFDRDRAENLTGSFTTPVRSFTTPAGFDGALVVADDALWRVRPEQEPERLSADTAPAILDLAVDRRYPAPPTESAYHRGPEGVEHFAVIVRGDDGEMARTVLGLGEHAGTSPRDLPHDVVASAPDLSAAVASRTDAWFSRLVLTGTDGSRVLAVANEELKDCAVGPVHRITYAVDGQTLPGWVLMPPQSDGAAPAVVWVYGGSVFYSAPADAHPAVSPPAFNGQLYAAAGYAVIYPSTPLGRGGETDMPATLAKQVVASIDAAAEAGYVDPGRVAVIGQSFGGYSTAAVLAERSDRFRAGIALAGNYDWMMSYGARGLEELFWGTAADTPVFIEYIENGQPGLLQPFWKKSQAYMRNSPIFEVDAIDAPLLMLHGDMDIGPTSFVGAGRMYAALVRAGKQPTLVRYWGEGHMVRSEAGVRDQWQRISKWLDVHLRRGPARQELAGSDR